MSILLVITIFLPVLGSIALAFLPRGDDHLARRVAMGVALATLAFSLILLAAFRPSVEGPQFSSLTGGRVRDLVGRQPGRRPGTARHPGGVWTGRTEPLAVRPDGALADHGHLLLVGIDQGAGGRALRVPARTRDRAPGPIRQPRHHPLLHLLRVHIDPAVLPDRHLGRAAAAKGVGDVLPLHPGRQPADAPRRDRAGGGALPVLAGECADVLDPRAVAGARQPPVARVAAGRIVVEPAGPDLPAAPGRVRDQGADVPVPHLAAAGARRGADRRLGRPGRRAPQGGQLRAPAVQPRHDAARRPGDVSPHRHDGGDRNHLRRLGRARPVRRQAAGRL